MEELYVPAAPLPDRYVELRVGGVEHPTIKPPTISRNTLATAVRREALQLTTILNLEIMIANLLDEYPMLLFVMEAGLALALLLFIVLWTGKGKK